MNADKRGSAKRYLNSSISVSSSSSIRVDPRSSAAETFARVGKLVKAPVCKTDIAGSNPAACSNFNEPHSGDIFIESLAKLLTSSVRSDIFCRP
jgi:hypothetical protein